MTLISLRLCFIFSIIFININLIQCETNPVDEEVAAFLDKFTGNNSVVNLDTWEAPEEMRKTLAYYHAGFDDEERPIWVAEWGKWNVKKYVDVGGDELKTYDQYADQFMVRILQSIQQKSTEEIPVKDFIFIIDTEGYPIEQLASGAVIYNLRKFASWTAVTNSIEKGFIINTSFLAERMVNLVKPILGGTFSKFEVYGTNKAKWLPRLLKHVPRDQIPEWYGGSKEFKPVAVFG